MDALIKLVSGSVLRNRRFVLNSTFANSPKETALMILILASDTSCSSCFLSQIFVSVKLLFLAKTPQNELAFSFSMKRLPSFPDNSALFFSFIHVAINSVKMFISSSYFSPSMYRVIP